MPVVSKVKKCCNEKVHMNNDMYMTEDLIPLIANKYQYGSLKGLTIYFKHLKIKASSVPV